mgnify:CR=1 FL=1
MSRFSISVACRNPLAALLLGWMVFQATASATAQGPPASEDEPSARSSIAEDEVSPVAARVDIEPAVQDDQIQERLERILIATDWFDDPGVRVEEGVVFLRGQAESEELKKWAGNLARNTEGVAAVANQMSVRESSAWDFSGAQSGLSLSLIHI